MLQKTGLAMGIALLGLTACEADRAAFEEGATLETPEAVQEAPVAPIPPQPFEPGVVGTDTSTAAESDPAAGDVTGY